MSRHAGAPPFFGGLDSSSHRIGEDGLVEVASVMNYGGLAGVEYGAVGGGEGQRLQFLMKGEQLADQGFAVGRDFDGDGGFHKTSLFVKGHPS